MERRLLNTRDGGGGGSKQPVMVEGEKVWRVGFVNVQGWKSKVVEVGQLLKEQGFDVFGVAETFLRNNWEVHMEG